MGKERSTHQKLKRSPEERHTQTHGNILKKVNVYEYGKDGITREFL